MLHDRSAFPAVLAFHNLDASGLLVVVVAVGAALARPLVDFDLELMSSGSVGLDPFVVHSGQHELNSNSALQMPWVPVSTVRPLRQQLRSLFDSFASELSCDQLIAR